MFGKLLPSAGGPPIPLLKPLLVLGRHGSCDVPLSYPAVSSRHCELALRDGYWFVQDLGSSNGTRVNDTVCESSWLLPNDILAIARHRYAVVYFPPSDRPPPRVGPRAELPERAAQQEKEAPAQRMPRAAVATGPKLGDLVPCGGGDPIPLMQPKLVVGRGEGCDIVLRFSAVSARHCELEWTGDHWLVRDLGSRNGTRVNGVRCETQRLLPGSTLGIANLRYRVVHPRADAVPSPAAKGPVFAQGLLEAAGLARRNRPAAKGAP